MYGPMALPIMKGIFSHPMIAPSWAVPKQYPIASGHNADLPPPVTPKIMAKKYAT